MQVVFAVGQVHNVLAVQAVLGNARGACRRLLYTFSSFPFVLKDSRTACLYAALLLWFKCSLFRCWIIFVRNHE